MLKVQLIVVQGKPEGKTIPLTGPVFRIGRDETCHLRPSSVEVSRQHAEFALSDSGVTLRDLGSRNGTQLNGKTITGTVSVKSGDLIRIGQLTFALAIMGAPASASRPAGPPKSLDEVDPSQVESWLIADNTQPVPDRPSGVFGGDTISISTFRSSKDPKSDPAVKTPAAAAGKPPAPTPPAPAPTPPAPAPPPAPTPVAAAPPPPPPAPVPAPAPAPAPAPPSPAPAPAPVASAPPAPAPAPVPPPAPAPAPAPLAATAVEEEEFLPAAEEGGGLSSYLEGIVFEALPEGEADIEPESATEPGASGEESEAAGDAMPEELIDESNPFYVAKKKEQEAEAPTASAKSAGGAGDSSEAAKAILNKMLERRRGGGGR